MDILPPDKSKTFSSPIYPNMVRTGVISDGSCFFHALLYATSSSYRGKDETGKIKEVSELREHIYKNFTFQKWKSLRNGELYRMLIIEELREINGNQEKWDKEILPEIANTWKDQHITSVAVILHRFEVDDIQNLIDTVSRRAYNKYSHHIRNGWVDDSMLEYISEIFETNFVFISIRTRKLYREYANEKNLHYIVFCYFDETHYEIVGAIDENNITQRVFETDHPLIQSLIC